MVAKKRTKEREYLAAKIHVQYYGSYPLERSSISEDGRFFQIEIEGKVIRRALTAYAQDLLKTGWTVLSGEELLEPESVQ